MQTHLITRLFTILLLAAPAFSQASEHTAHEHMTSATDSKQSEAVEQRMEQMQRAYRNAVRSQSVEQMQPAVTQLIALSKSATALHYGTDPTTRADYKDGMHELQADLEELENALHAKNLPLARKILTEQIKVTRNQAHQQLGVDEEN